MSEQVVVVVVVVGVDGSPARYTATQPGEVDALVRLLDRLPQLAAEMGHGVVPPLGHLDQVGPGISQLLDRVSQLNHMTSRLPTVFRRRNHP